ncbi:MAG: TonB-dependent receptor, partial [Bacteroidia bacterium]|nr:TonB-dependent receptor [Bacteroidia bacterium]
MKGRHLRSRFPWLKLFVLMLLAPLVSFSQESIKVVDENMLPLIGAYVKFLDQEDITDENGIVVIKDNYNDTTALSFRYISYNDLELTLGQIRNNKNFVQMFPSEAMLEQVVIIGRTDQNEFDIPYMVSSVRSKEISSEMVQTAADALSIKGGAYIQKSQMGGGSPVLRGFEANRILLVVDGVRLNNAIYRNGHLQSSITIDPDVLQQAEIIYGPGSLMYGSDALGGVVHFRTKTPLLNLNSMKSSKQRLSSYVRYNSANNEKSFHAHHMYSARKFGVLSSITVRDFGDLKMGSNRNDDYPEFGLRSQYVERIDGQDMVLDNEDPNLQIGTGYKQYDFLQKWIFRLTNHVNLELNAQYSTSSDIPRYDNLIEQTDNGFRYAEWYYGPQDRLLISPKLTWNTNKVIFDKMIAIASFQNVNENRVFRFFDSTSRENQDDRVKVYGMTVDFQKRLTHNQDLEYGVDMHYNDVASSAFSENITNPGQTESTLTRYPSGGSSLTNIGAYMQFSWKNQDSTLNWINGFRWTKQDVMMDYGQDDPVQWPDYFYDGISVSDNSVVGITGVNYKKNGFCGRIVTGTAFRAANVDDLAKIRINSNEITVPNPELESERVWNSEIGLAYEGSNFRVGFTSYY